jgi:phosphate transport system permease protein
VLGLFSYSLFVRDLNFGRCIFSSGIALGVMVLPFIEVRAEKTFRELDSAMIRSAYALGCTKTHTILTVVLPACRGELFSGIILGGCYAMGATAPMIFTGAVAYAANPTSLFKPAMALPLHLYLLVAQGHTSLDMAYGTAFVMMAVILISNALVILYARRRQRAWKQQ